MANLKLHGAQPSLCTRRVLLVLKEYGIEYDFISVQLANQEQKSSEFLAKNAFGLVPVLDDDGFLLYESRAIARYLAEKFSKEGSGLVPSRNDLRALAVFEQAMSIECTHFDPLAAEINFEKRLKPAKGLGETDQVKVNQALGKLNAKLDAYEEILSSQAYLAGNSITLADLFHLPLGIWVESWYPELFNSRRNVHKWWESLKTRKSWEAIAAGQT